MRYLEVEDAVLEAPDTTDGVVGADATDAVGGLGGRGHWCSGSGRTGPGSLVAGCTMAILLHLGRAAVTRSARRRTGILRGRGGGKVGGTCLTQGAVVIHCGLAIGGGEGQGSSSPQGPSRNELID